MCARSGGGNQFCLKVVGVKRIIGTATAQDKEICMDTQPLSCEGRSSHESFPLAK